MQIRIEILDPHRKKMDPDQEQVMNMSLRFTDFLIFLFNS